MKTEIYTLPAYWASALINDDWSGLEDDEEQEVKEWLNKHPELGGCLQCSDESEFRWRNDANSLGTDCLDYIFPLK